MAQLKYGFSTPLGEAGGIIDLAPYVIDAFTNEEDTGVLNFGMGVVSGTVPGKQIKLPTSGSTAATFEGITTNRRTTEYDLEGKIHIRQNATIGVMRYGRIFGKLAPDVTPAYGNDVYLIITGENAGCFTNEHSESNDVKVRGRFLGAGDANRGIAPIELFNT